MRYIIDKDDLYLKQEEPIIISIGERVLVSVLPVGCNPPIVGRVTEVGRFNIKLDVSKQVSKQYSILFRTIEFSNIYRIEKCKKGKMYNE